MRLVCPNCDAQYEVDDAAIPPEGRDVQCSNCGHAWFQAHPDALPELEVDPHLESGPEVIVAEPEPQVPAEAPADPDPPPPAVEEVPPPRRRALDESVLAVLREEAEREAAVRRVEAPPRPVEVQQDLGLMAPPPLGVPPSVLAAREKFADLSADPVEIAAEEEEAAAQRPASRRELLPDIEEINSTLRAGSEPRGEESEDTDEDRATGRRRGFRAGFLLMIALAALLWSAYVMAPRIVAQVPGSEPAMASFVGVVDRARVEVDAALQSASRSLRSLGGADG